MYCCVHSSPPFLPMLSHISPGHLRLGPHQWVRIFVFVDVFLLFPLRATCPAHLISLGLITVTVSCEQCGS